MLDSGWASDTSEDPLDTLTLAVVPAGGGVRALGAEPATGCTACGWTWNFGWGAAVVVELDVLEEEDETVELWLPVVTTVLCSAQPAQTTAATAAAAIEVSPRPDTVSVCRPALSGAPPHSWKSPAYSANTAPWGSCTTAISPSPSIAIGGASTVPPRSPAFAAVATMSDTPK